MFVWDMYKDAVPFSENEDRFIKKYLDFLQKECPKDGAFLNQLNLSEVQFNWAPKMTQENGVLGAWSLTSPNKVFMAARPKDLETSDEATIRIRKNSIVKDWVGLHHAQWVTTDFMGVVIVHELIHKLQFQTSPILFIINRLVTLFVDHIPIIERIGIEYDARKNSETEEIMNFCQKMGDVLASIEGAIYRGDSLDIEKNEKLKALMTPFVEEDGSSYPPPYEKKYVEYGIELTKFFC